MISDHQSTRYLDRAPDWASALEHEEPPADRLPDRALPVRQASFTLQGLAARGLLDPRAVEAFCRDSLLADFAWRLVWAGAGERPAAQSLGEALCRAGGVLVFIHGWDGSGAIWEDLPARAVACRPRLLALVPDVNGFGGSPFATSLPPVEKCGPPAVMAAVERWLDVIGLRPPPDGRAARPYVFVGHSMGGAALFFLDEAGWQPGQVGRIAAAPALLMNDRQRRGLYRMLGAGIRLASQNRLLDRVTEEVIAPRLIDVLAGWGSASVRGEHHRIYKSTPEGVVARTFTALGLLDADLAREGWPDFAVYLAERDRLVGLQPALDLLAAMRFDPSQVRTVPGDHYFFSVGSQPALHAPNRDRLLADILAMHTDLAARRRAGVP